MLLSIAYGVLALLLVTTIVSASSVHLERKRLLALADLTALGAADALSEEAYYGRVPGASSSALVVLTPVTVRAAVQEQLSRSPEAASFEGLTVVEATTRDGRTAEVTLAALARPPLLTWVTAVWSDGIALRATSRARAG
jgi:hypothetical protein